MLFAHGIHSAVYVVAADLWCDAFVAQEFLVERVYLADHVVDAEVRVHALAAALAHLTAQGGVAQQFGDMPGRGLVIPGFGEVAVVAVGDDFGGAAHARGHHGQARGHGLRKHAGQPFPQGQEHEHIHGGHELGYVPAQPGEHDLALKPEFADQRLDVRAQRPAAHIEKLGVRNELGDFGGHAHEQVRGFLGREAGDAAGNGRGGVQPEGGANGARVRGGVAVFVEVDGAEDAAVVIGAADAAADSGAGVELRDHDEFVCHGQAVFFCGDVDAALEGVHAVVEGPAVHGVDDHGHASAARGHAAQNAGFAAVGVHDVVAALAHDFFERAQGAPVVERVNFAHQGLEGGEAHEVAVHGGHEFALCPELGADEQVHFVALGVEQVAGVNGGFLRAAHDEARDDGEHAGFAGA